LHHLYLEPHKLSALYLAYNPTSPYYLQLHQANDDPVYKPFNDAINYPIQLEDLSSIDEFCSVKLCSVKLGCFKLGSLKLSSLKLRTFDELCSIQQQVELCPLKLI